ncbi:BRcat domain-containing protein [Clostridium sp.]|uniref:BRcat domain-containing protein n=1 Tax=Clostridium sp. TaxID=1506 RepID=UPI003D6D4C8A
MGNLKNKLAQFMYGRYGTDQLYIALIGAYFILIVANTFIGSSIISILMFAVLIWTIFRTLSRNIYKRRMENEKFMKIWKPVKSKGTFQIRKIKEIKTHRFRKCPHCKKVLRLKRVRGKHTVKCPSCNKEFEMRILL